MAIEAELADGRILEFPDGTDPKVIQTAVKRMMGQGETTIGGQAKELVKGVVPGTIGLLETAGVGASALLPDEYETKTREFIKGAAAAGKKPFEAAPGYEESIGRKLGEGVGSTVPFFALGPMGLAGRVGAAALGVGAGAGEARQAAEAKGATAEERRTATQLGAPVGLLDMLAPNIGPLKNAITTALARGGMEGATEAAQKISQNLIAKGVYDPTQDVLAGSGEEGAYGAGIGALSSLLVDLALGRKARGTSTKPSPLETPLVAPEEEKAPLALGMNEPFVPVGLPDGSVANTPAELDAYRQQQEFGANLLAQPADVRIPGIEDMTPAGAQGAATMAGFTGAPNANMSMMEQARAARDEEVKVAEKERKKQIKAIQAATFHADPIQNQQIKDRMLGDLGVTQPEYKAAISEPEFKEPLTPEELALAEAREPMPGEGVSPNVGLAPAEARAQQRQIEKANSQNKAAPEYREDINQLAKDRAAAQKALDEAGKSKGNLFNELRGKIGVRQGAFGPSDLNIDESSAKQLINKEGKGRLLEDMVADGSLDEYLTTPHSSPSFDAQAAVQEIADKLANKDYRTTIASAEMRQAQEERDRLDRELDDLKSMPDANVKLGQAAEELKDVETLTTDDLVARAQELGIDTEGIAQDVARQTENMTAEQYHGAARNALISAINSSSGDTVTLSSVAPGEKGQTATKEEVQMQKDLLGKDMIQAAQYVIKNAPNAFYKFVGNRILQKLKKMQDAGIILNFGIEATDRRNGKLYDSNGITTFFQSKDGRPSSFRILLNGVPVMEKQNGYPSGMNYKTLMHELLHVATQAEIQYLVYEDANDPAVLELYSLYKKVAETFLAQEQAGTLPEFLKQFRAGRNNALESADEMLTWSMTDERMQKWMSEIKVGDKTLFSKIIDLIRSVMGISKPYETALDRLVRTADQIIDIDTQQTSDGMRKRGYYYGPKDGVKRMPKEQQSLFSRAVQDMMKEDTKELRLGKDEKTPTPTGAGVQSMKILNDMGRGNQEAEPGYVEKVRAAWDNARDNPKATMESAKAATSGFLDRLETWAFSSDAALNNRIREEIKDSTLSSQEKIGMLLNTSLSQTVHSDAVASLFLQRGGIKYNESLHKWEGVENQSNFVKLSKQLDALAEKNGLTKQQAELVAHTAFEAKRLRSMVRFNKELKQKIATVKAEATAKRASSPVAASALSKEAARLKDQFKFISEEQMDMIQPGMDLFKVHPELNEVVKTWNEIRENTVKTLVDTGLWSVNEAEEMLSNADYVPFYREEQLENNQGPKEFIRGLQVQAKEKRLKGSSRPVNDIFDNQVRWVQYSINRAVRNRSALALAETAVEVGAAKKVDGSKAGDNVVRVWRNGEEQFYSMDDPMFMEAFTGLEAIVIPSWKWASEMANVLRQSVVMYPLFSVAQVPQDSFAAMFSSGLKPQYALRIPVLAVKEFVQTLRGKSKTHEELKNVGAVGVRDFTSAMVRMDAEIYAGLKAPPGVLGKVKYALNHIAMAADNAVRQAVYEAAIAQGVSRAEAMEKAFEVFNVRRKGSSKSLALAGQLIPFFNAYLAAQNVAYKTITGRGISPTERQDAFKTLAATTASVMVLSLMYAMLNGDDEDYLKKPATVRDRLLMIPGTGMSVPLRADLFTMPKIITEHMYLMMTDKGYEDGRKFRDSMKAALGSAVLGPTAVPQAIKPLVEVGINYDFFQGRPLVGTYQQKLDTERQFTDSTSELGKILGKTGLVSPIAADHLIRGMFGSAGGLIIYATNPMLHSDPNTPRPSLSERDAIATLPGMGGFMTKSYESALKKDFYTLKEEVDKAANTLNDLKTRSPQEIGGFLEKEENLSRVGLQKSVNAIGEQLSQIRKAITQTTNSSMPADQKQQQIEMLRKAEEEMLKGVNVKMLRELGKI
jgi:hypothetical protein